MGQVNGLPNATQRGTAAHIRQADNNSGRTMLNSSDRQFVNKVIHDPNMNYSPQYTTDLNRLNNQHFGSRR